MPDEESFLELLDIYMSIVDKQDEIIQRLGKVVAKQAADIEHYKNLYEFVDMNPENAEEMGEIERGIDEYRKLVQSN